MRCHVLVQNKNQVTEATWFLRRKKENYEVLLFVNHHTIIILYIYRTLKGDIPHLINFF